MGKEGGVSRRKRLDKTMSELGDYYSRKMRTKKAMGLAFYLLTATLH